ncbi:MAG: ABC transporter substrate-binding protein [Firmicutes bacterium]|nr:ABC transporter substrate-binding protein [Bacillota bacterium]
MRLMGHRRNRAPLLVALVLALLLFSVWSVSAQESLQPKKAPSILFQQIGKPGGTLTLRLGASPKSFNFYGVIDSSAYTIMMGNVLEPLVEANPVTQVLEPALASSWDVSKDGKTVVFHLRPGVKWSDGVPFTADDVVFTMENVLMDPNAEGNSVDRFTIGGKQVHWYKVDEHTVKAVLPQPYGAFLQVLSQAMMVPKHKLAEYVYPLNPKLKPGAINNAWTTNWNLKDIVGTGPFQLAEYTVDQKVVLTRNPYYWKVDPKGNRLPYVDKLVYLIVPDDQVALAMFKAGQIDRMVISGQDYPMLKKEELAGGDIRVFRGQPVQNTPSPLHVAFNFDEPNPALRAVFRDLRFREAVDYAINRSRIIDEIYNGLAIESGVIGVQRTNKAFYNPAIEKMRHPYDLKKAAELLDAMHLVDKNGDGVRELPNGEPLRFTLTAAVDIKEHQDTAVLIRDTLQKIGIKVDLQLIKFGLCFDKAMAGEFQAMILAFGDQPDPQLRKAIWQPGWPLYYWHRSTMTKDGKLNQEALLPWEKTLWQLFEQGETAMNPAARKKYYDEVQVLFMKELPVIFLVKGMDLSAVHKDVGNAFQTKDGVTVWTNYTVFKK